MAKRFLLRTTCLSILAAGFLPSSGMAEEKMDEVVVTATRVATPVDQVGSSVTVITKDEIEAKQATKVEDVLKSVPGVAITRQGGMGSTSQIRMRGTEPNHTLVLLNGQRVNYQDTSYNFDFDWLQTDDIERIEVLRGPAAGQWGSDAVGGVVNIVTKKGKGPMKVTALGELGSYHTNKESLSASGGGERYDYNFGWSRYRTDGWSTSSQQRGYGSEKDGAQNNTYHAKLGVSPTENSEIEASYSHTDFWGETDGTVATGTDRTATFDTMRRKNKHVDAGYLKGTLSLFDDVWTQTASASGIKNDQWNMGGTTTGCTAAAPLCAAYEGTTTTATWQNDLRFVKDHVTTLGVETTEDKYFQHSYQRAKIVRTSLTTTSGYVQHQAHLFDMLDLSGGWRANDHETYGWHPTWQGAAAIHLPTQTTLKTSLGTTFKSPLQYQVYYPSGTPNPELKPEEGRGWDAGVEQKFLGGKINSGLTWFRNDISNLIEYVSSDKQYQNVSKASTYGVESFLSYMIYDDAEGSLLLSPNYTYTRSYDRFDGGELSRKPRHKFGSDVTWRFLEKKARLNLGVTWQSDFQENRVTSTYRPPSRHGQYFQFDLAGSYDLTDTVQLFGRAENLNDRYHESAWGYAETGGRAFYAGMKVSFEPIKAANDLMKGIGNAP